MTDTTDTPAGQFNDMMHAARRTMSVALADLMQVEADRGTPASLVVAVPLGTLLAAGDVLFEHFGADADPQLQKVAISILRSALHGASRLIGPDGTFGLSAH